eukprot:TCALIF_13204-PA protein Name:"Similar to Ppn Papilin (Drosophila melanogaster)" AED:0.11 eAED:0.11 QI:32/0.42/0.25/1/0.14/0.25/8/0/928
MFCFLILAIHGSYAVIVLDTFEADFGEWRNVNQTWERVSVSDMIKQDISFPKPKNLDNQMILVPKEPGGADFALMTRTLEIPDNSILEIEFSCLVCGWQEGNDPKDRMGNPILQVLYDDTLVFHLETSIMDNLERFSAEQWNEFRLHSSFLAIDSIRVEISTNKKEESSSQQDPEGIPLINFERDNGSWKNFGTDSLEDEEEEMKETIVPEFCDLFPEKGDCFFFSTRYFFNKSSGACEKFLFGGCNGNENNFILKKDCQKLCINSNEHEDETVIREGSTNSSQRTNLTLTFDTGFEDWEETSWQTIEFGSTKAKEVHLKPYNFSSQACAAPVDQIKRFQHPKLLHSLELVPNGQILFQFSLKLVGDHSPSSVTFFESFNPGFKIFLGPRMVFNFALEGERDKIRIEAWRGRWTNSFVALDDLIINQTSNCFQPKGHWIRWTTPTTSTTPIAPIQSTTTIMETCRQPSERGPCAHHMNRFFFNFESKSCDRFDYSGCGGNDNNFATELQCQNMCLDKEINACQNPMVKGPCSGLIERFYYNAKHQRCSRFMFSGECEDEDKMYAFSTIQNRCIEFMYTGCGGNENLFTSQMDCQDMCEVNQTQVTQLVWDSSPKDCQTLSEMNRLCPDFRERSVSRWIFSSSGVCVLMRTCQRATNYGYLKKHDCEVACLNETHVREPLHENCLEPAIFGQCNGTFSRFFYDPSLETCLTFTFSGCFGNENNFMTLESCLQTCRGVKALPTPEIVKDKNLCWLPKVIGSCADQIPRYYFDRRNDSCLSFNYSGCSGNLNNFMNYDHCQTLCGGPPMALDPNENLRSGPAAQKELRTKLAPDVISWIVVFSLLFGVLLVIGMVIGVRYYRAKRSMENYRLFSDERPSQSESSPPGFADNNPVYSTSSSVAYNSSTNAIQLDVPRGVDNGNALTFTSSFY